MDVISRTLFDFVGAKDETRCMDQFLKDYSVTWSICWKDDLSPLMIAAKRGHVNIVNSLIRHGADVNAISSTGKTALMEAAQKNQLDVIVTLLRNGADRKAVDKDYWTAYLYAVSFGHMEAAELLDTNTKKKTNKSVYVSTDATVSENPPVYKTLFAHHLAAHHISPEVIALCEDKLVRQEGLSSMKIFVRIHPSQFDHAYLTSLGITGMGVQQALLDLHAECIVRENINNPCKKQRVM